MSIFATLASTSRAALSTPRSLPLLSALAPASRTQTRSVSSSPYGRTHVWKRRPKQLPRPMVPVFPQRLVRVDGSTVVHTTTSPRSLIRLTRDTTNNPLWNAARFVGMDEEEDEVTGRMGRFSRRFADLGGLAEAGEGVGGEGGSGSGGMEWMNEASGSEAPKPPAEGKPKGKSK